MAIIKVIDNYQIDIDSNKNHESREFIKMYINPKEPDKEIPQYRLIGHYSSVPSALNGIYKDMRIQKANKKDSITVKEWIDITKECDKYMETVILREVGE